MENTSDNEKWISQWALVCGLLMTVGTLIPLISSRSTLFWYWTPWQRLPGNLVIISVIMMLTVLLPLILRLSIKPRNLAPILLGIMVLLLIIGSPTQQLLTSTGRFFARRSSHLAYANVAITTMIITLVLMSAFGHLCNYNKNSKQLYLLLGFSSALFLIMLFVLLLSSRYGTTIFEQVFFRKRSWMSSWHVLISALGLIFYAVTSLINSFTRSLHDFNVTLFRTLLMGIPVLLLIGSFTMARTLTPSLITRNLINTAKLVFLLYGLYILAGVSLCATVKQFSQNQNI